MKLLFPVEIPPVIPMAGMFLFLAPVGAALGAKVFLNEQYPFYADRAAWLQLSTALLRAGKGSLLFGDAIITRLNATGLGDIRVRKA
jgi:hypothetical protein